jgi:hypothetical protein
VAYGCVGLPTVLVGAAALGRRGLAAVASRSSRRAWRNWWKGPTVRRTQQSRQEAMF